MKMPSLSELQAVFAQDEAAKQDKKPIHRLNYNLDELTCIVYVDGVLCVLEELGQDSQKVILHVNDRTTISDFPIQGDTLSELSEMTGWKVKPEKFLWEVAKALSTKDGASIKHRPRYH